MNEKWHGRLLHSADAACPSQREIASFKAAQGGAYDALDREAVALERELAAFDEAVSGWPCALRARGAAPAAAAYHALCSTTSSAVLPVRAAATSVNASISPAPTAAGAAAAVVCVKCLSAAMNSR